MLGVEVLEAFILQYLLLNPIEIQLSNFEMDLKHIEILTESFERHTKVN